MTREQKLRYLSKMIDDDHEEDDILGIYLDIAGQKILNRMYPFMDTYDDLEVPARYDMIQLNIAAYLINKRGAEGENLHIEAGTHRSFEVGDIPTSLKSRITAYAGGF